MALSLTNTFLQSKPSLAAPPLKKVTSISSSSKRMEVSCRKKDLHPQFYEDAKVFCNNEQVMTTGGTMKEYVVDVWSGNHPFYLGNRSANMIDDDQVEKFRKKYGELTELMTIPNLKGEIILPSRRSKAAKGGKKK